MHRGPAAALLVLCACYGRDSTAVRQTPPPSAAPPSPVAAPVPSPQCVRVDALRAPRKIHDARVAIPESVRGVRVHGMSVLIYEATITAEGAVEDVRLLKPHDPVAPWPGLDGAARKALHQWRYEPVVVDGRPVCAVMTITVMFHPSR